MYEFFVVRPGSLKMRVGSGSGLCTNFSFLCRLAYVHLLGISPPNPPLGVFRGVRRCRHTEQIHK